jgi:hypothetical protein
VTRSTSLLAWPRWRSPGEILITADAAAAAGIGDGLERRVLELRGKQQQ